MSRSRSRTLDLGEDLVQATPLTVLARVARTNRGLIVSGRVRTALADACARCLAPLRVPIDAPIEEEVLPLIDLQSGLRLDTTAEPEVLRLTDHHELDLEPLAREAIQLAAPIAPVCRPDCRGLCRRVRPRPQRRAARARGRPGRSEAGRAPRLPGRRQGLKPATLRLRPDGAGAPPRPVQECSRLRAHAPDRPADDRSSNPDGSPETEGLPRPAG